MKLGTAQEEFTVCTAQLINFAVSIGVQLTYGDAYRSKSAHGEFGEKKGYSSANSVHKLRLAVDFNVRIDGEYIEDGEHWAYKMLGDEWKKMHKLARWGGDFKSKDSNHFGFEFYGCM